MIDHGYIDLYCERTEAGLLNEPLNAISNLAFIFAAVFVLREARRLGQTNPVTIGLILLGGSIGVGSLLFHTFANSWSELADVIPIWTFVALYVVVIIHRSVQRNTFKTLRIVGITACCTGLAVWLTGDAITTDADPAPNMLNGSIQYLPAVLALGFFAVVTQLRKLPARNYVTAAFIVFLMSVIFRSVDLAACEVIHFGSHFLWHILNGVMVALLLLVLVRFYGSQPEDRMQRD